MGIFHKAQCTRTTDQNEKATGTAFSPFSKAAKEPHKCYILSLYNGLIVNAGQAILRKSELELSFSLRKLVGSMMMELSSNMARQLSGCPRRPHPYPVTPGPSSASVHGCAAVVSDGLA